MKHFCRDFHLNIKISKPRVLDYTAPYEGTKPNFTTFTCHSAVANDCKFKIHPLGKQAKLRFGYYTHWDHSSYPASFPPYQAARTGAPKRNSLNLKNPEA